MLQTRLFQILMYILRKRKTTLSELAGHFEVNIRTIQRDIDRLSVAGVPIITKQGFDGGVFIDESYKLSRDFLSDNEIETIIYALLITKGMSSQDKASQIISKLMVVSPQVVSLLVDEVDEYFKVDLLDKPLEINPTVMEQISHAFDVENKLYIRIAEQEQAINIAPISCVLRNDGMYLYAYASKYLLIKVSDIKSVEPTNELFVRDFIPFEQNNNFKK